MSAVPAPPSAPSKPVRSRWLLKAALVVIVLLAAAAGGTVAAIQHARKLESPTDQGQQRAGLVLLADELLAVQRPVAAELAAARAVWPAIAGGLPAHPDRRLLAELRRASAAAEAVPLPAIVNVSSELTGPGPRLARIFHDFMLLTQRGFAQTREDVEAIMKGPGPAASFARQNAGLYISSVYDGLFSLSLLGEKVLHTYERLGAEAEFGAALPASEVQAIVSAYSPQADRLAPHDVGALSVQK